MPYIKSFEAARPTPQDGRAAPYAAQNTPQGEHH
ncbi:hypothetical protein L541_4386, partial [Bordetella hinzii CA90 BAL1384]